MSIRESHTSNVKEKFFTEKQKGPQVLTGPKK